MDRSILVLAVLVSGLLLLGCLQTQPLQQGGQSQVRGEDQVLSAFPVDSAVLPGINESEGDFPLPA